MQPGRTSIENTIHREYNTGKRKRGKVRPELFPKTARMTNAAFEANFENDHTYWAVQGAGRS